MGGEIRGRRDGEEQRRGVTATTANVLGHTRGPSRPRKASTSDLILQLDPRVCQAGACSANERRLDASGAQ